ncbi:MAG: hypothetical protein ACOC93_02865, partial [Planctomycetota bacterium]
MNQHLLFGLVGIALLWSSVSLAAPADKSTVFQYATDVEYERKDQVRTGTAHLWIPSQKDHVRGVLVAGLTSMERRFVKNPIIRNTCEQEGLALLFVDVGLRSIDLPDLLEDFARKSGYDQLPRAPLMFVGHSAGGPQAQELAKQYADRCFGLIQHRGGLAKGVPADVPALASVGQFDEFGGLMRDPNGYEGPWERARDETVRMRTEQPEKLASFIVDPGAGHFAFSREEAEYLAMFIRKAADARIPDKWWQNESTSSEKPLVPCKPIDHRTGWLTDLDLRDPDHKPAPWDEYEGDRGEAAWHFDQEIAKATAEFHAEGLDKKDQFIKWEDRHWVDGGARIYFINPQWVDDGQTFEVHPVYRETYPEQHNGRGPRWLEAGEPVGHSDAPIQVRDVHGPLVTVGDRKLRMQFDGITPIGGRIRGFFIAYSEGDEEYRYTEHLGMLPRGFTGLSKGED